MVIIVKKSLVFVAVALACSLVLIGCNSKEKQLEGTWKVDMAKLPAVATSGPGAAFAQQVLNTISVEFKSDHTFAANTAGQNQQGTWKLDGNTVTLTATGGKGSTQSQTATLSDDGRSLSSPIPGQQGQTITLVKQSS